MKYQCSVCGYVYDPLENDHIDFLDLTGAYECPDCGSSKSDFVQFVGDEEALAEV
jgi:rubredoxin